MPSTRFRNGYRPTPTRLSTCPKCGEQLATRYGQTTHTPNGRAELWRGTLVELIDCHPDRVSQYETTVDSEPGV